MFSLSIVIPAYNEQRRICNSLERIRKYLHTRDYDWEIIVVDDGSQDATSELVRQLNEPNLRVIRLDTNRGKGCAVKTGVLAARKEWVLFTDADLSTPIEDIEGFIAETGYDVLIGSRRLATSEIVVYQPFYRMYSGQIFNLMLRVAGLTSFKDTQCGMKMFRTAVAQQLFALQRIERFSFDVEILYLAKRKGVAVKEVAVHWYNDKDSKVRFFRDSLRMFLDLLRIRWNALLGRYN